MTMWSLKQKCKWNGVILLFWLVIHLRWGKGLHLGILCFLKRNIQLLSSNHTQKADHVLDLVQNLKTLKIQTEVTFIAWQLTQNQSVGWKVWLQLVVKG